MPALLARPFQSLRTSIAFLVVAVLAFGLLSAAPAHAATTQYVTNGNFAEGSSGWHTNRGAAHRLTVVKEGRSGTSAAVIVPSDRATVALNDTVDTVRGASKGTTFTMTAWVRADKAGTVSQVKAREGASGASYTHEARLKLPDTGWHQISVTFATRFANSTLDLNVLFWGQNAGQKLLVNSVSLTGEVPVPQPPVNPQPPVAPQPPTQPGPGQCVANAPVGTEFGVNLDLTGGRSMQDAWNHATTFGTPGVVRVFNSGAPSNWSAANYARGADLAVSFKISPQSILNGSHDAQLRTWFRAAPTNVGVYWTYFHEPEDDIAKGDFTATQFRAAWQRIATIADEICKPNLHATLVLMDWTVDSRSGRKFSDYYPGSAYVDVLGWDPYNPWQNNTGYKAPAAIFGEVINVSKAHGKPFAVAETGSLLMGGDKGTQRATWLRATGEYLRNQGAVYVTYFDAVTPGGKYIGNDFRLRDAPSIAAWKEVVER